MKIEEVKPIRLLDKDENVLCSIEGVYIYEEDSDDEGEFFYIHPTTGDYCEFASYCLQGWSEVDAEDNENWQKLIECIQEDSDLLNKFYCSYDGVDYRK